MESFDNAWLALRSASTHWFEFSVWGTNGVQIHRRTLSDRFPELNDFFQMDQTDEDFESVAESLGFDTESNQFSWGKQWQCSYTFVLFIQFVYTGKYVVLEQGNIAPKARRQCYYCRDFPVSSCLSHGNVIHGQLVSMREKTRPYLLRKYGQSFPRFYDQISHQSASPCPDNSAWDDYSHIFETHLKVFLFAQERHLGTLCRFATYQVQQLFLGLVCYRETVNQVVQFLEKLIGQITNEDDGYDDMVTTVAHFAVCYADKFWANAQFAGLIRSNEHLGDEFIRAAINGVPKCFEEEPCDDDKPCDDDEPCDDDKPCDDE